MFKKIVEIIPLYLVYLLALLFPLAFTNLTTEYFETAKLIFLGTVVLLIMLVWVLRAFTESKIAIVKTPLDLLLILFLIVSVLSTVLSQTPFPALFGLLPKVSGSLISIVILVLLYFMVVSNVKTKGSIQNITSLLLISGLCLAVFSILSFFKLYLPFKFAAIQNFSLAGSSSATALFLSLLLPLSLSKIHSFKNFYSLSPQELFGMITTLFFTITIILVGNLSIWLGTLLVAVLTFWVHLRGEKLQLHLAGVLGFIGAITLTIAVLAYTPTLKDKTEFGNLASSFPKEVQLPITASWKVSAGAFGDSPVLGTGPGTYLYNFTQYKPIDINQTNLWDKKISSAYNQYFQTWAELGGAGLALILLIATTFIILASKNLDPEGLGLSGIAFFIMMAFAPTNILTAGLGFLILALFMASLQDRHQKVRALELNLSSSYGGVHPLLPTLLFIPVLSLVLAGFYFLGKMALGEYYNRLSLKAFQTNKGKDQYNFLIQAERANPEVDSYRVNLAQINLSLANAIAAAKGPTEASPGGTLTDDDKKTIQTLLQQSIAEGKAATTLAPRSSFNWEVLAGIYKQLTNVAPNATQFALDSYGRAIQHDPFNPILRLSVGDVYYSVKNYDLAVRFYDDSVSIKPDFTNGMYKLAIALRDKGNNKDAIAVAEKLVAQLQDRPDSKDYQVASDLLSQLKKAQNESASAQPETAKTPLEQSNTKVELPKPEKIATPPAVQK